MMCLALVVAIAAGLLALRSAMAVDRIWHRLLLRVAGTTLLVLSFGLCLAYWGWSFGIVAWPLVLTVVALCIVLSTPWVGRARFTRPENGPTPPIPRSES